MEFIIGTVSIDEPTEPPIQGAYKYSSKYTIDYLLDEYSKKVEGYYQRPYIEDRIKEKYKYLWLIEVDSLDELLNISETTNEELVVRYDSEYNLPVIEIYDWYRE